MCFKCMYFKESYVFFKLNEWKITWLTLKCKYILICFVTYMCSFKKFSLNFLLVYAWNFIWYISFSVLTVIFSFLDDFSLWNCSQVSKRWCCLIEANNTDEKWRQYTRRRWQLFQPTYIVPNWRVMYTKL